MAVRIFEVAGHPFQIPEHYEPVRPVGHGAYGVVCCCRNIKTGEEVAIKRVKINQDVVEAKRALREIKLLRLLDHENILSIGDILPPGDKATFDSIYLVTPFFPADLSVIIKSSQALTEAHCQTFLYQVVKGLKYMHSANVLHRDLKPNNLLVNRDCELKICDLGLSRMKPEDNVQMMTTYVVTRWYRAPELIMCSKNYDHRIDVWSVGCIFAELLARRPLFPGKDYVHQLELIIALLGTPSEEDLTAVSGNDKAARYARSLFGVAQISLDTIFSQASPLAIDLLKKMLVFNPNKRITAAEVLCHPYLADHHDPTEEACRHVLCRAHPGQKVLDGPLDFEQFAVLEREDVGLAQIRELIWEEANSFRSTTGQAAAAQDTEDIPDAKPPSSASPPPSEDVMDTM